ncbi:MAG: hypothetical protein HC903_26840 [Methylacidiphilales bacterium]|nr:hypothetical protein [Candidatus Methylacidiphilales bacterium]NJR15273.1 hypothetical protein [Calothrix sp. CSU_2_0]
MQQQLSPRPHLMEALDEVKRSNQCNMFNRACVILAMHNLGYIEEADWLAANIDSYLDILIMEYQQWMHDNEPESLAQQLARETGLKVIVD